MYKFILGITLLLQAFSTFANPKNCSSIIIGYNMVKNSLFQFLHDKKKACFFAFYIKNPDPIIDVKGNGNNGPAIWYGYYILSDSSKIYELPKPSDSYWGGVCSINAVSFYDINNDKKRDITVIGSCDKNAINYTIPFVFIRHGDTYIFDEDVYNNLYGAIALTISDVHNYIKDPDKYYPILKNRYNWRD